MSLPRLSTTPMSALLPRVRRWRHPDLSRLILILAAIVATVVVVTTFLAIWGYFRLNGQASDLRSSRYSATYALCNAQALLAGAANEQTRLYENLIVSAARGSIVFEPLYRSYGAPSYPSRIRQAVGTAAHVEALLLPIPECHRFADLVRDRRPVVTLPTRPAEPKLAPPRGVRPMAYRPIR